MPIIRTFIYLFIFCLSNMCLTELYAQPQIKIGSSNQPSLTFQSILGNKIALDGNANGPHTGIGVQSGLLQFYVPDATKGIFLNNGTMSIMGNGNVGINRQPGDYRLDIAGNMLIRSQPGNVSSGIWLSNAAQTADPFFIGMLGNTNIGFYYNQTPVGWGPNINSQFGNFVVNGSTGAYGQMITSGGSTGASSWQSGNDYEAYQLSNEFLENGSYNLTDGSPSAALSGLYKSQTYTKASKVQVMFNVQVTAPSCAFCGISEAQVSVSLNGSVVKSFRYSLDNATGMTCSGSVLLSLTPGVQIINVSIQKVSGPALQIGPDGNRLSNMILAVQPTN
jgi:hypothetical protein